jgi:hypothetical protein
MNDKECWRLRGKIEASYRKDIEALNRVWRIVGKINRASARAGALLRVVRPIVEGMDKPFTIRDVEEQIRQQSPTLNPIRLPSITTILTRLVARGVLELVVRGSGRRPSLFRRICE